MIQRLTLKAFLCALLSAQSASAISACFYETSQCVDAFNFTCGGSPNTGYPPHSTNSAVFEYEGYGLGIVNTYEQHFRYKGINLVGRGGYSGYNTAPFSYVPSTSVGPFSFTRGPLMSSTTYPGGRGNYPNKSREYSVCIAGFEGNKNALEERFDDQNYYDTVQGVFVANGVRIGPGYESPQSGGFVGFTVGFGRFLLNNNNFYYVLASEIATQEITPSGELKSRTPPPKVKILTDAEIIRNVAPTVQALSMAMNEDTSATVTLKAIDPDVGDTHTFVIVQAPNSAAGSATISGSKLIFNPKPDWNGSTSLTYRARDSSGALSAPATVSITVHPVNDLPIVTDRSLITPEDTTGVLSLSATDRDDTSFTFQIVDQPANGSATINGASLSYMPPLNWSGKTALSYRAKDASGGWSNVATVSITVSPVNDSPVVTALSITVNEDTAGAVTLQATDVDSEPNFVFQIVNAIPANEGSALLTGNQLQFTPRENWNGNTMVTYRARDLEGAWSTTQTISITVRPVNDSPVARQAIKIRTLESQPVKTTGAVSLQ